MELTHDTESRHMNKCINNLLEQTPSLIFRQPFCNPLKMGESHLKKCVTNTYLLECLTFHKFLKKGSQNVNGIKHLDIPTIWI